MLLLLFVFFFFSSRRRHTRSLCDWSSDVCSSDLEVQHGGFLSNGGAQEISIVSQPFKDKGQYIISATRPPSTPGVSGSGTLLGLVVKAVAPGTSPLSIVQVNAKDSQQKPIQLVTSEATLQVQP